MCFTVTQHVYDSPSISTDIAPEGVCAHSYHSLSMQFPRTRRLGIVDAISISWAAHDINLRSSLDFARVMGYLPSPTPYLLADQVYDALATSRREKEGLQAVMPMQLARSTAHPLSYLVPIRIAPHACLQHPRLCTRYLLLRGPGARACSSSTGFSLGPCCGLPAARDAVGVVVRLG